VENDVMDFPTHAFREFTGLSEGPMCGVCLKSDGFALYAGADNEGNLVQLHVGGVSIDSGSSQAVAIDEPSWMLLSIAATARAED
jgi:hypothetical protein